MAKVFTIPVPPNIGRKRRERTTDPRYVDGQRLLVEAMKYLAQADPIANRGAIELLSEHVRTRFRMSDSPLRLGALPRAASWNPQKKTACPLYKYFDCCESSSS